MKKQDKIDLLQKGIDETATCRCFFSYEPSFFYCYPHAVSSQFLLGQEEDDFTLDGYFVRKIAHLEKVEMRTNKCDEINRIFGVAEQVNNPQIDISSWRSIFGSLAKLDIYVIIEDHIHGQFAIGAIQKVLKDKLYFRRFDANGVWDETDLEIRYSQITSVEWGSRYAKYWKCYLDRECGRPTVGDCLA